MKTRFLLLCLLAVVCCPLAQAFDFNYRVGDAASALWGLDKRDNYDVAVRVASPALTGMKITEVSVPLAAPSATKVKVWLSSALTLKKVNGVKTNAPDILSVDAQVDADGMVHVVLPEAYTLTDEGVYVGYSFSLSTADTEADKKPVAVYATTHADGFYVHTTRTYFNWESLSAKLGYVSAMQIELDGTLPAYGLGIVDVDNAYAKQDTPLGVTFRVANHGTEPIHSFAYHYSLPGLEGDGVYQFDQPLLPQFSATREVSLSLPALGERGRFEGSLAITKVQDADNVECAPVSFPLAVLQFMPHKRVVMEEYTSTSCGWCPRGTACIEHITADYPDRFLGVAWHQSDEMTLENRPARPSGLPAAYLDRGNSIGAGYWDVFPVFSEMMNKMPKANIEVSAWVEGDSIKATSQTFFVDDQSGSKCRVAYLLIGDGICGDYWMQSNYYHDLTPAEQQEYIDLDPYLAEYMDLPKYIADYKFPSVVVYCNAVDGIPGSLPADIVADTPINHSTVIPLANVVGSYGDKLIQENASYRLVALVIDGATSRIVNAGVCNVEGLSVSSTIEPTKVTPAGSVRYYTLQGRPVSHPTRGLYIKVEGGRSSKIMI